MLQDTARFNMLGIEKLHKNGSAMRPIHYELRSQ